ncbi:hypothetical protein FRC07_007392 [Ceratobasidium sp. 392]|nr:hypothetical protein FRC07_007392 [Ceratobasidium sp. 392]
MPGFSSNLLGLKPPRTVSPYLSLTAPLTRDILSSLKQRLSSVRNNYPPEQTWPIPKNTLSEEDKRARAAVLIPLCNVGGRAGLLLEGNIPSPRSHAFCPNIYSELREVRGKLRNHGGEVSFPGGKVDETDSSHIAAAIRETEEELGVDPAQVEILGSLAPPQISLRGLRVYPYVVSVLEIKCCITLKACGQAFIHPQRIGEAPDKVPSSHPLPSLQMSSLRPSLPEVPFAFHLPLSETVEQSRLRAHAFRGQKPYWKIDVTDKVAGVPGLTWASATGVDEVGGSDQPGKLEVWGLTGWYVNILMQWLGVYH